MTETVELKACPWHGSPENLEVEDNGGGCFWVVCTLSGCGCEGPYAHSEAEARTAWNTRSDPAVRDRVKPLEWKRNSGASLWTEELIFGVYYVLYDEADGWRAFRGQLLSFDTEAEIAFGSEAAVKAAAQADYEQRILSALEPLTSSLRDMAADEAEILTPARLQDLAWSAAQAVCEWDDRTSPEGYEEYVLLTPMELRDELIDFANEAVAIQAALTSNQEGNDEA